MIPSDGRCNHQSIAARKISNNIDRRKKRQLARFGSADNSDPFAVMQQSRLGRLRRFEIQAASAIVRLPISIGELPAKTRRSTKKSGERPGSAEWISLKQTAPRCVAS
jgi:hypothetical protein